MLKPLLLSLAATFAVATGPTASAQTYPTKTVKLIVPFAAIAGFHDPAVDFALQFQAQGGEGEAPPEHAEAENDKPVAVPAEDGSNVVSVDFKRKK